LRGSGGFDIYPLDYEHELNTSVIKPAVFEETVINVQPLTCKSLQDFFKWYPDISLPTYLLVQISWTSMETFRITILRKYIIQLNIVFHGNKITFYLTENNNLSFYSKLYRCQYESWYQYFIIKFNFFCFVDIELLRAMLLLHHFNEILLLIVSRFCSHTYKTTYAAYYHMSAHTG
jgi:hypothetical protein